MERLRTYVREELSQALAHPRQELARVEDAESIPGAAVCEACEPSDDDRLYAPRRRALRGRPQSAMLTSDHGVYHRPTTARDCRLLLQQP